MFNITNSANLDAARVGFHIAFLEMLGITPRNALEDLYTEVQSTTRIEEWDWMGDLPDFQEWNGDRVLAELKAFTLRILNKDWSNGIRIHQNDFADDRLGLLPPKIAQLAQKARSHRVRLMVKLLINGFDGVQYTDVSNGLAYDGKFFFSSSRVTGVNKLTTALTADAAGLAALQAAEKLLQKQTSYDGVDKLEIMGTDLIIGPDLVPAAEFLMKADFIPSAAGTATQTNIMKGRYKVHVSPLLVGAYAGYWFIADLSKPVKPFLFQMRDEITTSAIIGNKGGQNDSESRFANGTLKFGAEARYNVAYLEPRLIVGSQV